jgi:hypothetical protein
MASAMTAVSFQVNDSMFNNIGFTAPANTTIMANGRSGGYHTLVPSVGTSISQIPRG